MGRYSLPSLGVGETSHHCLLGYSKPGSLVLPETIFRELEGSRAYLGRKLMGPVSRCVHLRDGSRVDHWHNAGPSRRVPYVCTGKLISVLSPAEML